MKTALVTGVSKGIGRAIALKLSEVGYKIHGTYNTSTKEAQSLQKLIQDMTLHKVDFGKREDTLNFIESIKDIRFDAVINNAGVIIFEKFDDLSIDNWDQVFNVNIHAPFLISHGLRNSLNKKSVIVNIASTDAFTGSFSSVSYSATKAALISITKSLGNIFAKRDIRVVGVAPGWVGSGMNSPAIQEAIENNPMGRNAEASEIAETVAFLVSSAASYINGQTIVVDGGYTNVDPVLKKESESL